MHPGNVRDPYEVLGVGRSASEAELKAAFRKLAAQHHPDKNPGDEGAAQRFKDLNQAYQILSDPQKRAAFDRFGESAFRPGGAPPADFTGLEDLFGDFLGAFGFKGGGDKGAIRKTVQLSFEEAAHGCERQIPYERVDLRGRCHGSGGETGTRTESCAACGGRGKVRFQQALFPIAVERPCSRCRGSGKIPTTPCIGCQGVGLSKATRRLEVQIPAGIEPGSVQSVEGAGNRVRTDRPAGNLELVVEVEPHAFFRRVGDDIVCKIPISFSQAALGGEVEVPTLEGNVRLRVPPATQVGSVLRLRGKGIAHRVRNGHGDQLVEVTIEVPSALSERGRQLLIELGHELGDDVQPQEASFMEKLKGLFG
ncbi:MAG: molecular chaperone DnaJ [Polyangiaceae bacterium]